MNGEAIIIVCDESVPEKIGKEKLNLYQLWHKDIYPDDYLPCKIAFYLARKCNELHLKGLMIANEWNEGNILISTTDCSVSIKVVHAMNLSRIFYQGTEGYLAPECYINRKYDLSISLAAPVIYGSNALFAFNPNNQSNSIRNHVNELMPKLYEIQTQRGDATDERIKKCFIQTFTNGLQSDSKRKRTTDREWMQTLKVVAKTGLKQCPVCHRRLFIGRTVCPWCK